MTQIIVFAIPSMVPGRNDSRLSPDAGEEEKSNVARRSELNRARRLKLPQCNSVND